MKLVDWARDAWRSLLAPSQPTQPKNAATYGTEDPYLFQLFGIGTQSYSGVEVGEHAALGLSAVYRAVKIISSTVASLPLHTLRQVDSDTRQRVSSFLDDPGGLNGPTRYEWTETLMLHLLLHGNAYLHHVRNGAGTMVALELVHPLLVSVDWELTSDRRRTGRKVFRVTLDDNRQVELTQDQMTHIPGLSSDGLRGYSPIWTARNSLGTAIAGDNAAAKLFAHGALFSGIVTVEDDDATSEELASMKTLLGTSVGGWENAGTIMVTNRKGKFTPWSMSMEDAQFLESRQFSVEEVARWFGVPPHLLMQTEKQTSWGTGVAEQNRGLARYTLMDYTTRIQERLSRLLPAPRFVEFDYAGLLKPAPEQEIPLLIQQVQAGLMTPNEARRIRGMDPIEGGDTLQSPQQQQLEAVPA